MLNKDLFCIENLFFIIPNQIYLSKTGACSIILGCSLIWGHSVILCVTSTNPPLPLQTLTTTNPPLPLQIVFSLSRPWSQQTLLCVTSSTSTTCRDLLCMTSDKPSSTSSNRLLPLQTMVAANPPLHDLQYQHHLSRPPLHDLLQTSFV